MRILLLKGAKRDIMNLKKEKPIDKIPVGSPKAEELRQILISKFSFWTCMNIKTPLKKITRNEWTSAFFFVEFIVVMLLTGVFILPLIRTEAEMKEEVVVTLPSIFFIGLATLLIVFFCLASFKDPGYVQRDSRIDFQELLDKCNPLDMCPECKII